jgi:hypothetical protein
VAGAANKHGITIGKKAFVPCKLGNYDVLAAELPGRDRKVLVRYPCCSREKWLLLSRLRHHQQAMCRNCKHQNQSSSVQPRFKPGDVVGSFTIVAQDRRYSGGWKYLVRDNRCGHEKQIQDTPIGPFKGVTALCECPVRVTLGDRYIGWRWTSPGGARVIVREHRIIMEQHLGRELYSDENVHHINGVRNDNRLPNLELWSTSQPSGQRVEDHIAWAAQLLTRYGEDEPYAGLVRSLLGGKR